MRRALLCGTVCLASVTGSLNAQSHWNVSFGVAGASEIARSRIGTAAERVSGGVFGGEARVSRGPLLARLRYGQGRLTNDSSARDVAEAEGLVGYQARPWLTLSVGPHARTFLVAGQSDRRWLFWSARVVARGSLFPGRLESFVELWQGVGKLNRPAADASGGGLEAGLEYRLAPRPLWGRLSYRVEQARVAGSRRETVETFMLTVGYVPFR